MKNLQNNVPVDMGVSFTTNMREEKTSALTAYEHLDSETRHSEVRHEMNRKTLLLYRIMVGRLPSLCRVWAVFLGVALAAKATGTRSVLVL